MNGLKALQKYVEEGCRVKMPNCQEYCAPGVLENTTFSLPDLLNNDWEVEEVEEGIGEIGRLDCYIPHKFEFIANKINQIIDKINEMGKL